MATLFKRWTRGAAPEAELSSAAFADAAARQRPAFLDALWLDDAAPVRESDLPRFSAMASDDVEGVGEEPTLARARLALRDTLGASQPVTTRDRFSGRHDALTQLIAAIEQQRVHVVVYGERGIGKTSLAHVFADTAREARYIVLYGSCGTDGRFDEIFRAFAAKIPMLYHRSVLPTTVEVEQALNFDSLLPAGPFGPREVSDLFSDVVGTRVILILDEYDRIADPHFRRDVAELIKNLSDRAARVQLVVTGVASNLDELIGFAPSIRRNIIGLPMRPLNLGEVAEILHLGQDAAGLYFTDAAVQMISTMANGSPYLVRLLGHRAGIAALDQRRTQIDPAHAKLAVERVLTEWNATLPRRIQSLLAREEARAQWPLLVAAAEAGTYSDGWFVAADVAAEMPGGPSPASIESELRKLATAHELLESEVVGPETRFRYRFPGVASLLLMSASLARLDV
ncbi:ATP-binding protein [Glacieibacterium megasporae]|uniref:ATP-binding protein n=1 Tax=Glacieibacterium megasporae TaxID=2835787 RepID=UPI001C1E3BF6|nr:ATP-binding protein [Polymorphobacter megasporae]UAJ09330.1 ATP-binding protein [Polymorphobacter megasporae]